MWSQSPGSGRVSVASVTGTKAGDWATTTEIAGLPAASAPSSDAVARKDLFTILASGGILRHYSKDDRRFALLGRRRHRPFRLRPPVGRRGRTNPPPSSRSTRAWSRHDARPRTLVVYRSTRTDPAAAGSFYPLTDITAPTVGLREMLDDAALWLRHLARVGSTCLPGVRVLLRLGAWDVEFEPMRAGADGRPTLGLRTIRR